MLKSLRYPLCFVQSRRENATYATNNERRSDRQTRGECISQRVSIILHKQLSCHTVWCWYVMSSMFCEHTRKWRMAENSPKLWNDGTQNINVKLLGNATLARRSLRRWTPVKIRERTSPTLTRACAVAYKVSLLPTTHVCFKRICRLKCAFSMLWLFSPVRHFHWVLHREDVGRSGRFAFSSRWRSLILFSFAHCCEYHRSTIRISVARQPPREFFKLLCSRDVFADCYLGILWVTFPRIESLTFKSISNLW